MIGMARKLEDNPMLRLLQMVPLEGMSVHQISCRTGIDRRTVKRNVQLIMAIQAGPKVKMEIVGLRLLVRREK
jgi:DNA-binding transcriptional regulator LsrR (DeoR family)